MNHWNIKHKISSEWSRYFNNCSFKNQQLVRCLSRHLNGIKLLVDCTLHPSADTSNQNCSYAWIIPNSTKQILKFAESKTLIPRVFIKSDFHIYKLVIFPFLHI